MTATVLNKTASVTLPGLGKLWKKKKLPLRQQEQMTNAMQNTIKTAAFRAKAPKIKVQPDFVNPSFMQKMRNAAAAPESIWNRMGGSNARAQADLLRDAASKNVGGDLSQIRTLHGAADAAGRRATVQKAMRNVGATGLAGAPAMPLMMGNYADGTPVPAPGPAADAPTAGGSDRLKARTSSPFGGLWDDIVNPESDDDRAARAAKLQSLGDNASLLQRWQLADPSTRYLLLTLLLGGGIGMLGSMGGRS